MQVLMTPRLRLRWFRAEDAGFMLGLLNEPSWQANISDAGVRDEAQALAWMEQRLFPAYWRHGHGFWAVERREDGALLGLCGLFQRDFLPHPDLGYGFPPRFWGQGYAREAARACLQYAREALGLRRVLATTALHNETSMRLLRDCGFEDRGEHQFPAYEDPSRLFEWCEPGPEPLRDDAAEIAALSARLLGAFDNREGRVPGLAALPYWLLPGASIAATPPGGKPVMSDVRGFVLPRAELLFGGRLQDFAEWELEGETRVEGAIAQRWLRYRKRGRLDGQAFEGEGLKTLQLVRGERGWRIAALAWQDLR